MGKILVAYESKYGATSEVAERIGAGLQSQGLDVSVLEASKVKELDSFQAVILGSAVYYGRWRKGATKFLKKFQKQLSAMPIWFFSSGPIGEGNPVDLLDGWQFPPGLKEMVDSIGPRDIIVFHGKLESAKLTRLEKKIMEALETPAGDFRKWEMIDEWVDGIVSALV